MRAGAVQSLVFTTYCSSPDRVRKRWLGCYRIGHRSDESRHPLKRNNCVDHSSNPTNCTVPRISQVIADVDLPRAQTIFTFVTNLRSLPASRSHGLFAIGRTEPITIKGTTVHSVDENAPATAESWQSGGPVNRRGWRGGLPRYCRSSFHRPGNPAAICSPDNVTVISRTVL